MSWNKWQKPFRGKHWWYRVLTGKKWTFPYMNPLKTPRTYWKCLLNPIFRDGQRVNTEVECKLLNFYKVLRLKVIFAYRKNKTILSLFKKLKSFKTQRDWVQMVRKSGWGKGWEKPNKETKGDVTIWTSK